MQFIPDLECLDKVQIMKRERPFQINTLDSIRFRIALVLFVVTILAITSVVIFSIGDVKTMDQELPGTGTELSVSYLEDPAGQLTLEEILQTEETSDSDGDRKQWRSGADFRIGNSRSTWWARIRTDEVIDATKGEEAYFSVLTPSVEHVALYLPNGTGQEIDYQQEIAYQLYESGWGVQVERHDDVNFTYPTFRFSDKLPTGAYLYLKLNSIYTQNYAFKIYRESDFEWTKKIQLIMFTFFVGFLVAVGINNLIQYAFMGTSAHLYYFLYLFLLILYQGSVLGLLHLYIGSAAEYLVGHIAPIVIIMFATALAFYRSVLETKKNFPLEHKISGIVLVAYFLLIVAYQAGFGYEVNQAGLLLINLTTLFMMHTAYRAIRRNISQAKFLFAGWSVILIASLVFSARAIGVLPNTELTTFIILFPFAIEAVLLSMGVTELSEQNRRERENALQLYYAAEGQVLTKESAFLQAQIQPHFLYNALNIIAALCLLDGKKAAELIQDLSKFLRHSFDFRNLERTIGFKEELEFIQAYVKIEQARFHNKLNVTYELEETEELQLPPLLLQPLIENAIRHGIRKQGVNGTVNLRVRNLEQAFEIIVEDNGIGMTEEQIRAALSVETAGRHSVGLANIQKRLQMFYDTGLVITSTPGAGTKVTVLLPKKGKAQA